MAPFPPSQGKERYSGIKTVLLGGPVPAPSSATPRSDRSPAITGVDLVLSLQLRANQHRLDGDLHHLPPPEPDPDPDPWPDLELDPHLPSTRLRRLHPRLYPRPDLFNDSKIEIHGIQGFIGPLTAFSCLSAAARSTPEVPTRSAEALSASLRIHDAIVHLRAGGYSILALAMRIKSPELMGLQNMTVFALDDPSIFNGITEI